MTDFWWMEEKWYIQPSGLPQWLSGKKSSWTQVMHVWSLGQEDPLKDSAVTHSSLLAWRIPWTEEPGRLQSTGSQKVEHNWSDRANMHTASQTFPIKSTFTILLVFSYYSANWMMMLKMTFLRYQTTLMSTLLPIKYVIMKVWRKKAYLILAPKTSRFTYYNIKHYLNEFRRY